MSRRLSCLYCGCQWSGDCEWCAMSWKLVHEKKSQGFLKDILRRGEEDDQKILWGCADPTEDDVWVGYFSKLDHQDKSKAFLKDVRQCGTKFEKQRQQKEDFLDWYPWRFDRCMCDEDMEEEHRVWCKMGKDNPYYHEWDEAMARPGGAYKPPEIHPFCDECGLFHADDAKWCHYYKIGEWCKECAIPHDWRLPWPHP